MRVSRTLMLAAALLSCAACARHDDASRQAATNAADDASLPTPQTGGGDTLTGMTDKPGPNPPGARPDADAPVLPADAPPAIDGAMPPPGTQQPLADGGSAPVNPETGALPGAPGDGTGVEPTPADAVEVIRDYYASINSRSYARAYALWSDGGGASHQTPEQFANGFATTARVDADVGAPANEDAGAGQRYIQVPVTLTATRDDGSTHRYAGTYTLHRTVVDGASAEQRAWRIASASLREVRQ